MENNIEKYLRREEKKGRTIKDIINLSGIGRTSFYEIKAGRQVPKLNTAIQISKALNVPIHNVFPELKEVL